jgi:hypothetical protein
MISLVPHRMWIPGIASCRIRAKLEYFERTRRYSMPNSVIELYDKFVYSPNPLVKSDRANKFNMI